MRRRPRSRRRVWGVGGCDGRGPRPRLPQPRKVLSTQISRPGYAEHVVDFRARATSGRRRRCSRGGGRQRRRPDGWRGTASGRGAEPVLSSSTAPCSTSGPWTACTRSILPLRAISAPALAGSRLRSSWAPTADLMRFYPSFEPRPRGDPTRALRHGRRGRPHDRRGRARDHAGRDVGAWAAAGLGAARRPIGCCWLRGDPGVITEAWVWQPRPRGGRRVPAAGAVRAVVQAGVRPANPLITPRGRADRLGRRRARGAGARVRVHEACRARPAARARAVPRARRGFPDLSRRAG